MPLERILDCVKAHSNRENICAINSCTKWLKWRCFALNVASFHHKYSLDSRERVRKERMNALSCTARLWWEKLERKQKSIIGELTVQFNPKTIKNERLQKRLRRHWRRKLDHFNSDWSDSGYVRGWRRPGKHSQKTFKVSIEFHF